MDTEELIKKCSSIALEEEDEDKIMYEGKIKEKGEMLAGLCLIGKILLNRGIHIEGLRNAMRQVWKTFKEVKIESLGENFFMFKFGTAEDKKRVFSGGPWHFDNALIVFSEPKGVGDVKKQAFTHTSFWVQLHNVPLMCMDKYAIQKLGSLIGKVEEVDTDKGGECVGPIFRTRISVNVTKPLKKILFLQQEDGAKTPIGIQYERLPDFCFCCGLVGHQYRECLKYKGQPKEKLAYGAWLKALTVAEWNRKNRGKGNWSREHQQGNPGMGNTEDQNPVQIRQTQKNLNSDNRPGQSDSGQPITSMEAGKEKEVVEEHLMSVAVKATNIRDSRHDAGHENLTNAAGKSSPREMEGKAGSCERRESGGVKVFDQRATQTTQKERSQNQSEIEESVNGPIKTNLRPKTRRWKAKAREQTERGSIFEGKAKTKRPSSAISGQSPKSKRAKLNSPSKAINNQLQINAPAMKIQLAWEQHSDMALEDLDTIPEDIAAGAGEQPRRQL